MRNVCVSGNILKRDYEGGFVESRLHDGLWSWLFYESRHVNQGGSLKENADWSLLFTIDGIVSSNRRRRQVDFTYKPYRQADPEAYTLSFATENEAKVFNGEAIGQ